jgi:Ca2+-binding RTX toxin-like protein
VVGSDRKNFLIGTDANNALFGLEGDDLILVGEGNNLAFGGKGNDTLLGGSDDDILFGGPGDDILEGGAGDDTLFGGEGNDILYGGAGGNRLIGGAGADIFRLGKPGAYVIPLVGEPGLAPPAADLAPKPSGPDIIVDFSLAEGDIIDLSLIAAQPLFAGSPLLPFVSLVQVGSHTHLQVTSPLGQTTTEAILLNVEANTLTPAAFSVTPPDGLPAFK